MPNEVMNKKKVRSNYRWHFRGTDVEDANVNEQSDFGIHASYYVSVYELHKLKGLLFIAFFRSLFPTYELKVG